ncbi:hypothetical protein NL676_026503 [Syzygium grande]|nr:hypothetical protein NL676_026503 [Syzygium grande]
MELKRRCRCLPVASCPSTLVSFSGIFETGATTSDANVAHGHMGPTLRFSPNPQKEAWAGPIGPMGLARPIPKQASTDPRSNGHCPILSPVMSGCAVAWIDTARWPALLPPFLRLHRSETLVSSGSRHKRSFLM